MAGFVIGSVDDCSASESGLRSAFEELLRSINKASLLATSQVWEGYWTSLEHWAMVSEECWHLLRRFDDLLTLLEQEFYICKKEFLNLSHPEHTLQDTRRLVDEYFKGGPFERRARMFVQARMAVLQSLKTHYYRGAHTWLDFMQEAATSCLVVMSYMD
jgi:hypothetical protein